MRFSYEGTSECLQGINNNRCIVVSVAEMIKQLKLGDQLEVIQLFSVEILSSSGKETTDDPVLEKILKSYEDIFAEPHCLPPERIHVHQIILKSGTSPISVRPYQYPSFQKDEIEKQGS